MRLPNPQPQELRSTQVLVRFSLRMIVLVVFAMMGSVGFAKSFAALLWMSTILSAVVGAFKRERPFDTSLNYWDETAVYAALFCLAHGLDHPVPT